MSFSKNQFRVAIILLNYNSASECRLFLESLYKYEDGIKVYVVDNDSTPSDLNNLKELSYDFELISLATNKGYAAGNNAGISKAISDGYEYIAIANADTRLLESDTIKKLISTLNDFDGDIIGPKLVSSLGSIDSGIVISDKYGRTKRINVESLSTACSIVGAFWLMRADTIKKFGFLPEEYFLYREETDYMENVVKNGGIVLYQPKVTVLHDHGATTGDVWDYYFNRNTIIFAERKAMTTNSHIYLFHLLKTIYLTGAIILGGRKRKNKLKAIRLSWKAYIDGINGILGKTDL